MFTLRTHGSRASWSPAVLLPWITLALCAFASPGCKAKPRPTAGISSAPSVAPAPAAPSSAPASPVALIREQTELVLDGVKEQWRIEWTRPPEPACVDENRFACDCTGFAYGERGSYDIVRARPGAPEEHLHFTGILQRWPILQGDEALFHDGPANLEVLRQRPPVTIMDFLDYDHDGRAAEFVLQVDAGKPCMRTWSMIVGVQAGRLRMFSSEGTKGEPLVLGDKWSDWEEVRTHDPAQVTELACGDHNARAEIQYLIRPGSDGFDVTVRTYECITEKTPHEPPARGRLLQRGPWRPEVDLFRNRHEGL